MKIVLDIMPYMAYNKNVKRETEWQIHRKEKAMADETKDALKALLELIAKNPELADRITITIRPNKKPQGK